MRLDATTPAQLAAVLAIGLTFGLVSSAAGETADLVERLASLDVPGGMVVQLGVNELDAATQLGRTGRFIVQVLTPDPSEVRRVREHLQQEELYGLISVDLCPGGAALPYTENLVNLAILQSRADEQMLREIFRMLRPAGLVMGQAELFSAEEAESVGLRVVDAHHFGQRIVIAGKPWPEQMDEWTHPRHSASGNAVSEDTLVGPPRRVRWLSGPWQEVANLVTIGGRNYYGGLLARDGFNGLRLWQRQVAPTPAQGGFSFRPVHGSVPPVTGGDRVFVFSGDKLLALDARTGETVQEYPEAGTPRQLLYDDGLLVTTDANSVRCLDARTGRPLWQHAASEPRHVVAGDGLVALVQGSPRRGETCEVVVIDQRTGQVTWSRSDLPWAERVTNCVYHQGMLSLEVSTLNDEGPENAIHIVSTDDGHVIRALSFLPGMNHMRQARAMFVGDHMWLLQGGRGADNKRTRTLATAIDVATGGELARYPAGLAHCFPPVATSRYLFSGEMDLTDLQTGEVDANRITKAACGRDAGWFPAHGLINVTPKHCVCWPMLRGYTALAPARPGGSPADKPTEELTFTVERAEGMQDVVSSQTDSANDSDWPCYRHDPWRSGSTPSAGPVQLQTLWTANLGEMRNVDGPILEDWREDPYIKGPISPPVIAGEKVFVARPHAHQVVALDAATGAQRWCFTANGRVDTPPTIHRGLCLFGSKRGWVYCLRADDGQLVWRMQVAPLDEQIVAYGQLESPWPVPGSVLVVDDVAYFAAGRQSFADGGILIFAVDPATGDRKWVQRLDSVPQPGFYTSSALEFDNFDLLHQEGDGVAMSRWVFDRATGTMSVDPWKAFARLDTGQGSAMVPQGCWSYAPRNETRTKTFSQRRPLVVFRDNRLVGCLENKQSIYCRDFNLEGGEEFDTKWITGWANSEASRTGAVAWRSQRLAEKARWTAAVFSEQASASTVDALVMAGDRIYLAGSSGQVRIMGAEDGTVVAQHEIAPPLWDGLAVAAGRLYLSTTDGRLLCIGE